VNTTTPTEKEPTEIRRAKLLHLLGPLDTRQRYTINEAAAYLRQSRGKTYQQINDGTLPVVRVDKRVYVHGSTLAAVLAPPAEATAA
jgi:excisionase family DNA binding protein